MPPVLAITGKKNSGKTTLLERLIPELVGLGYKVGTIKHHHGDIRMDVPGKDTWRHKQAGAHAVVLASPTGLGFICDYDQEIPVSELASRYLSEMDLVLVEGYKNDPIARIEIYRSVVHADPLPDPQGNLIAMMSDVKSDRNIPHFGLGESKALAQFIVGKFNMPVRTEKS